MLSIIFIFLSIIPLGLTIWEWKSLTVFERFYGIWLFIFGLLLANDIS